MDQPDGPNDQPKDGPKRPRVDTNTLGGGRRATGQGICIDPWSVGPIVGLIVGPIVGLIVGPIVGPNGGATLLTINYRAKLRHGSVGGINFLLKEIEDMTAPLGR